MFYVYTDGSFQSSLNAGGWSAIIVDENNNIIKTLYKGYINTTNNRMELMGVLYALKYFKTPTNIKIYSDSQYVVNSIVKRHVYRWFENEDYSKKNLDLWFQIIELLAFHKVTFEWVKGHENNDFNNLADKLAVHAAQCLNLTNDKSNSFDFQKNR